jgi:hypothetical protein
MEDSMNKNIIDRMKNEGKPFRNTMIIGYILAVMFPLAIIISNNDKYTYSDIISFVIAFFIIGSIGLYGWLYAIKYRLKITKDKLFLKTLFKKININMEEINYYNCKRYRKSVFYQFRLYTSKKKFLVSTRYKDEFKKVLYENKIIEKEN